MEARRERVSRTNSGISRTICTVGGLQLRGTVFFAGSGASLKRVSATSGVRNFWFQVGHRGERTLADGVWPRGGVLTYPPSFGRRTDLRCPPKRIEGSENSHVFRVAIVFAIPAYGGPF